MKDYSKESPFDDCPPPDDRRKKAPGGEPGAVNPETVAGGFFKQNNATPATWQAFGEDVHFQKLALHAHVTCGILSLLPRVGERDWEVLKDRIDVASGLARYLLDASACEIRDIDESEGGGHE